MIPFPGESVGTWDAYSTTAVGWDLWEDIHLRGADGSGSPQGHRVIDSGDEWWCWAYHWDPAYLEAADDAMPLEVSWVVEVLSGSGTLVLSDFHDTGWDYATTSPLANALGSIEVDGAGTYLLTTTSFANAIIREMGYDEGPAQLHIECTSGSVDVQQVKLRAWPATGVLGWWSEDPVTQDPQTIYPTMYTQNASHAGGVDFTTQSDFRSALSTLEAGSRAAASSEFLGDASMTAYYAPITDTTGVSGSVAFYYLKTGYGDYEPPVGWMRPPEEVQEDVGSVLFQPTGPAVMVWEQGDLGVQHGLAVLGSGGGWSAYGSFYFSLQEVSEYFVSGDPIYSLVGSGSTFGTLPALGHPYVSVAGETYVEVPVSLPEVDEDSLYLLIAWHDGHLSGIAMDVTSLSGADIGGGGTTISVRRGVLIEEVQNVPRQSWTPAPFHYWDPEAIPPEPEGDPIVPAGYFLDPNANLDGLPDGIDVNFS